MILVCQIFHIILTFHRTRMYILHLLISLNQNNHWNPIVIMMPTLASLAVAEANNNIQWVPRVKLASWQLSISVISFWLSTVNDGAYKRRDGNFTKVSRIIKTARFLLLIFFQPDNSLTGVPRCSQSSASVIRSGTSFNHPPGQNGRHFRRRHFQKPFHERKVLFISIRILLKFVPKGPIDNESVLVQAMTWRRTGPRLNIRKDAFP